MKNFLLRWLATSIGVLFAVLLTTITASDVMPVVTMGFFLALAHTFVRPVLALLSLPLIAATLGLFYVLLNALIFWAASKFAPGLTVPGVWSALFGSIICGIAGLSANSMLRAQAGLPASEEPGGMKRVKGRTIR